MESMNEGDSDGEQGDPNDTEPLVSDYYYWFVHWQTSDSGTVCWHLHWKPRLTIKPSAHSTTLKNLCNLIFC